MVKHELLLDSSPNSATGAELEDTMSFGVGDESLTDFDADQQTILETKPLLIQNHYRRGSKGSRRSSTGSNSSTGSSRTRHKAGQKSYAEMITMAIVSTPEQRMTLSQIYDWMVDNVTGLQEQRSLHSSKGWKNAVRHTLSINPRFKRIQRQGRPGLWIVDMQVLAQRYSLYAAQSGAGGGSLNVSPISAMESASAPMITPPIFSANFLVHHQMATGDGVEFLESDSGSFRLLLSRPSSPANADGSFQTIMDGANAIEQHLLNNANCSGQKITVINEDGSLGFILLQNPVPIMTKSKSEACTQTEDEENNAVSSATLYVDQKVNDKQDVYSNPMANNGSANTVALSRYLSEAEITSRDDKCKSWIEQQQQQQQQQHRQNSCPHNFLSLPDDLQDINLDPSLYCNDILRDQYWF